MSKQKQIKLPAGTVKVSVSAPDYYEVERRVQITGNETVKIKLYPRRPLQESLPLAPLFDDARWQPAPSWQPQPALIIGLGGTGRHVLTHIKKNLLDAGAGKVAEKVRLALLDTGDYELLQEQRAPVSFAGVSLAQEDIIELSDDLTSLTEELRLHPETDPYLSSWFPAEDYKRRLNSDELNLANGTRQRRPPARAMLVQDLKKGISTTGVDVVLLLDCSESMGAPFSPSQPGFIKLKAAQDAAATFISEMDMAMDRVAVVAFNDGSTIVSSLSNQFADITKSLYTLSAVGATNIHLALEKVDRLFGETSDDRKRVVILLSDGRSKLDNAVRQAEQLKSRQVRVISIGIGDVDENLLKSIASQWEEKPDYSYAADPQTLKGIYIRLARQMGDGSRIWRLLRSGSARALDDTGLRVIIVGSLAGGFGSAILADLAYLARRAGKDVGAKSVSVETFLATDGVFNRVVSNPEVLQANTFAALREIERFQLAKGFPFRMEYSHQDPDDEILFGKIDWRLLDEVYLFDHLPKISAKNERQEKGWYQPELSVFPIMADAVVFSLDKAARTGELISYRKQIESDVTREQAARNRAVVGSLGVFRYYFPARDVFELLKARWARTVLQILLTGRADGDLTLDVTQNQEESVNGLERHVRLFLLGYAGYSDPSCPPGLAQIGKVVVEGRSATEELSGTSAPDMAEESKAYAGYLQAAMLVMLNGLNSSEVRSARTGKIGYVLEFLKQLKEFLKDAEAAVSTLPAYEELTKEYLRVTMQTESALCKGILAISKVYGGDKDTPAGLLELLDDRQEKTRAILDEQESILSRQNILDQADVNEWQKTYFSDPVPVDEVLSRLQWTYSQDTFLLSLRAWAAFALKGETTKALFLDELLTLAGKAGGKLLENERFSEWLKKKFTSQEQVMQIAEQAMQASIPLVDFSGQDASQVKYALTISVNAATEAQPLEAAIRQGLIAERKLYRLQSTDPYALTLVQTIDVLPLNSIESLRECHQTYGRWYGLTTSDLDGRAEPTAVFRAEKIALVLERRMSKELRQVSRILRPVVLTTLDAGLPARVYALAFAAGWVRRETEQVIISPPGVSPIAIKILESGDLPDELSPYVLAWGHFVNQVSAVQIKELQDTLAQCDVNLWRRWTTPDWKELDLVKSLLAYRTPDAEDFASVVALVVREELTKRLKSGA